MLSPVALSILTYLRVQSYVGLLRLSRFSPQTDSNHNFRSAPQTDLVTSACVLSSKCLCLDTVYDYSTYSSMSARSRLLFSLLFQLQHISSPTYRGTFPHHASVLVGCLCVPKEIGRLLFVWRILPCDLPCLRHTVYAYNMPA